MRDDRAQVLGQIRVSLNTAHLPSARASVPPRVVAEQGSREEMISSFRRELEPLGGLSYIARNDAEAMELVLKIMRETSGKELLAWDDSEIPVRGLGEALRANGYTRQKIEMHSKCEALTEESAQHDATVNVNASPQHAERKNKLLELERASAGITGALAGIADTGTLALVSSSTRPRLASLLPPTHIALLPTSRLFPNMAAFFAAHPDVTRDASNLVFVTGPSRTADIELTLQRGVHGPKFLHVVLLDY